MNKIAAYFDEVGIVMEDGFITYENSAEQNFGFDTMLTLPKLDTHEISLGVGVRHTKITNNNMKNSVENAIILNKDVILASPNYNDFRYNNDNEPAFWSDLSTTLVKKTKRTNVYGYAQDLISLGKNTDLVLGLRADDYSDFGFMLSKRVGLVYRMDNEFIFKLLYGSAYRTPTFIEAYATGHINSRAGYSEIRPEETDTYEAVFIYTPDFHNRFSINFYYSKLQNIIELEEDPQTYPGYINYDKRVSKGFEAEYNYKNGSKHNLYLNASYVESTYIIPYEPAEPQSMMEQSMPDISQWMLKGIYVYMASSNLSFGTTWKYFSKTTSSELNWVLEREDDPTAGPVNIFSKLIPRFILMSSKKDEIDQKIEICILHDKSDHDSAELLRGKIAQNYPNGIKNYPIDVVLVEYQDLLQCENKELVFLFNQESESITQSIEVLNKLHLLTMSYDQSYLQDGVAVSLYLGRKILPFLNMRVIEQNHITLDNVLVRVSKIYTDEK